MTLVTTPNVGIPDWEVSHIYQDERVHTGSSTVMLLRSTVSAEGSFVVDKIVSFLGSDNLVSKDATILCNIPLHRNIIRLYSTHVDVPCPGKMSNLFEFCPGEDLGSFSTLARQAGKRIPEEFLWHVLYQSLVALEHLKQSRVSHNDLHIGNLFLRPVQGDAYPDVVLADFEKAEQGAPHKANERIDFQILGWSMELLILREADKTADPYSQNLKEFVNLLIGPWSRKPKLLKPEEEKELIPLAQKMAYHNDTHQMPAWMSSYFQLISKATPRRAEIQTEANKRVPHK